MIDLFNNCLKMYKKSENRNNEMNSKYIDFNININSLQLLKHLKQRLLLTKLMPNVNAISVESNDCKNNNSNDLNTIIDISDGSEKVSKTPLKRDVLKELSLWQSMKYQFNRKVDTNDDNYKKQFTKEGETGLDRIKRMLRDWSEGEDNAEIRFVMSATGYGAVGGGVFGGCLGNKTAVQDFVRRHNEYVFRGEFEAKRRITDSMFLQFFRHGFRMSWRVGLFSGLITGLTTVAITYRNDIYYRDCMAAGAVVCSLWKIKLGFRAMAVSGLVGSILGLMFAGGVRLCMWTFNTSVPEYRYWRQTRYLGHLTVQQYSDGNTEFDWHLKQNNQIQDKNPTSLQ